MDIKSPSSYGPHRMKKRKCKDMIAKFAIDPEAIRHDPLPPRDKNLATKNLLEFWRSHGFLVNYADLDRTLSTLPDSIRNALRIAVSGDPNGRLYRRQGSQRIAIDWENTDRATLGDSKIEIVLPRAQLASDLGLSRDAPCCRCGNAEVTLWHLVNQTCEMAGHVRARIRESAVSIDIPLDQTAEELWGQRFQSYAEYPGSEVVLADPYAVRGLDEPRRGTPGLISLLNFLARDTKNCTFTIYSTYLPNTNPHSGKGNSYNQIEDGIIQNLIRAVGQLRGNGILQIEVYLLPDRTFHNRRMRFNFNGFSIGDGIDILEPLRRRVMDTPTCALMDVNWVTEPLGMLQLEEKWKDEYFKLRIRPLEFSYSPEKAKYLVIQKPY